MDEKMTAFISLMHSAFSFAKRAHDCSFNDEEEKRHEDKCAAMAYASACIAKYSAAEAIYWTTPDLAHGEIPDLFAQFDTFTHELLTDFETDHSRQWVNIEFEHLRELYENSVCSLPIKD